MGLFPLQGPLLPATHTERIQSIHAPRMKRFDKYSTVAHTAFNTNRINTIFPQLDTPSLYRFARQQAASNFSPTKTKRITSLYLWRRQSLSGHKLVCDTMCFSQMTRMLFNTHSTVHTNLQGFLRQRSVPKDESPRHSPESLMTPC